MKKEASSVSRSSPVLKKQEEEEKV